MHYDDPFELNRPTSHAHLTSKDLEGMGKQASDLFLCDDVPLNDAVIKVARECSHISPHQVRRVVEHANTQTFQRIFEKQAGDKNVEFPLADPNAVLTRMDLDARPEVFDAPHSSYSSGPVKTASADLAADIELCRAFGVEPTTPALEKAALDLQDVEGQMGVSLYGPGEADAAREAIKAQMAKRFALRHPWLTGVPTLGIAPMISRGNALSEIESDMVRSNSDLRQRVGAAWERQRQADIEQEKRDIERSKAEQMERSVGSLGSAYLGGKLLDLYGKQEKEAMASYQAPDQGQAEVQHRDALRSYDRRIELENKRQEYQKTQQKGFQQTLNGIMGGQGQSMGQQQNQQPAGVGTSMPKMGSENPYIRKLSMSAPANNVASQTGDMAMQTPTAQTTAAPTGTSTGAASMAPPPPPPPPMPTTTGSGQ